MRSFCHIYGQLGQTGDRMAEVLEHLFGLGLVCDTDFKFEQGERHRDLLAEVRRRGGLMAPDLYPATMDPARLDPNWWMYSEAECERLLRIAQERFAALDLGPLLAVNTYTPGNGLVAACRRLGIRYILGFCAPVVIEDGGWRIAHYGSPLSPYFVSPEDFRKPENPGQRADPVMMASMELRNPMVCLNHWSEGPWCPLNAQAVDRWLEPSGAPMPFLQVAEDWLRQTELSGQPRFFHLNLQYFFAGRCYEHNARVLQWLAEQRDNGRLEIGGLEAWAERLKAADGFLRQTTYWRGEMMGSHVGHRPGSFPDVIVDESLERQTVWQQPHALPRRCYDYARPWAYPAFEPDGTAPASMHGEGIQVQSRIAVEDGTTGHVEVLIENAGAARRVPLSLWNLLDNCRGPFSVEAPAGWQAGILPHPGGTSGALLLDGLIPVGHTRVELTVHFAPSASGAPRRSWGHLLEAQTFEYRGRPCTYLATQTPEPFTVTVRATASHVRVESLCGIDYQQRPLPSRGLALRFDGTRLVCWHRFWGARADELQIEGVEGVEAQLRLATARVVKALAPGLAVDAPGYQLFGNVRDTTRWDRALARAAGDAELERMNQWFHRQRPRACEVMIEAHPGIYLPRGSITKVLGHEFELIRCRDGYGFRELTVDYPQGWDWGVAAWVQWRHLRVRLEGLRRQDGAFTLHLHAFDPESRNIVQRIHLFNPETGEGATSENAELCVASGWDLPKGLDGRWQSAALCSVPIPVACLAWQAIGVWITPMAAMKLHDWVAEKGAPGLFSHLWVTRAVAPEA